VQATWVTPWSTRASLTTLLNSAHRHRAVACRARLRKPRPAIELTRVLLLRPAAIIPNVRAVDHGDGFALGARGTLQRII
jgi:hypothetical protein